jgi:hypothetical protein
MNTLTFAKHHNFELDCDDNLWGDVIPQDVVCLLDNVIDTFYENLELDQILNKNIKIIHSSKHYPQLSHPRYCTEKSIIYLHINGKKWDKYTYQFAHELCHYIIDKPSPESVGRFDWLEESLCELASFFCLKKMSQTWQINPPYSNWCDYAICLEKYPENQRPIRKDTKPFADWLEENIEELSKKRYMRDENAIIAWRLFSLFMSQSTESLENNTLS